MAEKQQRKINTAQLYPEPHFLHYCTVDENSVSRKIGREIAPSFLQACENDGLIQPLHVEDQKQKNQQTGEEAMVPMKFYSPFQIFLVSILSKNIIGDDGLLRDVSFVDLKYQNEQKTRYVAWGDWSAFNVEHEKNATTPPLGINHFVFAEDFHNFLRLLHSLEPLDYYKNYEYYDRDKIRLYRGAPELRYDLAPFRNDKKLLEKYSLNADKLKIIINTVGYYALNIDPLEEWYYYLQKHPQRRRDELKGLASVAQDLYGLCNILTEVIEIVTGKKLPPFLEYIHADLPSPRTKRNEYADGEDIAAIRAAHVRLLEWIERNKDFLTRIITLRGNERLVGIVDSIKEIEPELEDFQKKYGDVRYTGSYRMIHPSELKLADLDEVTKKYAEMFMKSHEDRKGHHDDEDDEDGEDLDFYGSDVTQAIAMRLGDLKRKVSDRAYAISQGLYPEEYRIDEEKRQATNKFQVEYFTKLKDEPDSRIKHVQFWQKTLPEFQKVYEDEKKAVDRLMAELNGIGNATRLAFCAKCRKNTVVLHQQHNDGKISREAICDDCISKTTDLQSIKKGEWRCEWATEKGDLCNTLLYKFVYNNILNSNLQHSSPTKITLEYGQAQVEITCPKCRNKTVGEIDWGWLP